MSEVVWQACGNCHGAGGTEQEVAALYVEPGFDHPQVRTAPQWVGCSVCLGSGQVRGGDR